MSEVVLAYLMPVSQLGFWCASLFMEHHPAQLFAAASSFHWLWALKNILVGPLKTDAGILTFLPGFISGIFILTGRSPVSQTLAASFSALLVLNFGYPVYAMAKIPEKDRYEKFAKRVKKTPFWARLFYHYCMSSSIFWGYLCYSLIMHKNG
eukprot:m.339341 g.339341  ORF g.339341 m.339341 type:complete len:152 (+) comp18760_c0_seq1:203-658(+)